MLKVQEITEPPFWELYIYEYRELRPFCSYILTFAFYYHVYAKESQIFSPDLKFLSQDLYLYFQLHITHLLS